MKFTCVIVALLISSLTSCSNHFSYISETNKTVNQATRQLCRQEKLSVMASGGAMRDNVKEVSVTFVHYNRVSIPEARRMCVNCVETIRKALNDNEKLVPYLNPYPFPSIAMDISIMFFKKNQDFVEHGCVYLGTGGVSTVCQLSGEIHMGSYNPRSEMLEDYYNEPYEEALQRIKEEDEVNALNRKNQGL